MISHDGRSLRRRVQSLAALILATLTCTAVWAQSSSASYSLPQSTWNATGASSAAVNFGLTSSGGQESTVSTSSSQTFILQSGFWGYLGSGPVQIVLAVDRNASTPENCDLTWSGNAMNYEVFGATDCANVFDSSYGSSSDNFIDNVAPPAAGLVCFNVRSFASIALSALQTKHEGPSQ